MLGLVGLAAWLIAVQATARSNLNLGKAALQEEKPEVARDYLAKCLLTWPTNAEAQFRAAQAERQCGDTAAAERHLQAAAAFGWDASAIELERGLIAAQSGNLRQVETTLLRALNDGHPDSHHVLGVLVPTYMAEFRWVEAKELAEKWTQLRSNSARAWSQLGEIYERLRRKALAVNATREAVRLNPDDRNSRLRLAQLLLDTRQPAAEAAEHLQWLSEVDPTNPAVAVQMAVCREAQGLPDQAAAMLDRVIEQHPRHAKALYYRGRLELTRGKAAVAAPFLRRAAQLDPSDPEILYSLVLVLTEVGTPAEAREAQDRWKQCEADLKQVAELAKAISAAPRDPDLRRQMGELFLRNGRESDGVSWLKSAIRERGDHRPSHQLLADYYDRTGQSDLATYHRSFCLPEN